MLALRRLFERQSYLVPNLIGMPEAEARNVIAPNGWEINADHERSDVHAQVGQVVRTAPGGRRRADQGRAVPHGGQ